MFNSNMLTRKQIWRRCNSRICRNKYYEDHEHFIYVATIDNTKKKRVHFGNIVNVVLIPSIKDDYMKRYISDIWNSSVDIEMFKNEYITEMKQNVSKDPCNAEGTYPVS